MSQLTDREIRELVARTGMIDPFVDHQVTESGGRKVVSYGLSSMGYDMRCGDDWRLCFPNYSHMPAGGVLDVKRDNSSLFGRMEVLEDGEDLYVVLPPQSFALTSSVEWWDIPRDILVVSLGKSTFARAGLIVNITPMEPMWKGRLTIEISNTTPLPAKVYVGEGIAQAIFFRANEDCEVSYADRRGKYQNQTETTVSRMK